MSPRPDSPAHQGIGSITRRAPGGRDSREFGQRRTMAINEHMVRRMKLVLGEIRVIVEDYAKGAGYDIVMDKSGMSAVQIPVLLYHKDSTDITAQVLKVLNKNAPAASATKEP